MASKMRGAEPQHAVEPKRRVEPKERPAFSRLKHRGGSTYLRDLRAVLGLSEVEMGVLLGVGKAHIVNVERRGNPIKPSARQHLIGLGRYYQDHADLPADAWATLYKYEDNNQTVEQSEDVEFGDRLPDDPAEDADPYGTAWRARRGISRITSAILGFVGGAGATYLTMTMGV